MAEELSSLVKYSQTLFDSMERNFTMNLYSKDYNSLAVDTLTDDTG